MVVTIEYKLLKMLEYSNNFNEMKCFMDNLVATIKQAILKVSEEAKDELELIYIVIVCYSNDLLFFLLKYAILNQNSRKGGSYGK